jgi:hypothetical protein
MSSYSSAQEDLNLENVPGIVTPLYYSLHYGSVSVSPYDWCVPLRFETHHARCVVVAREKN